MTLRIAHVGGYNRPSLHDTMRTLVSLAEIQRHDAELMKNPKTQEVVNLKYGRDFLLETAQYDIVIIHSVLFVHNLGIKYTDSRRTSPCHAMKNWERRLATCGAAWIANNPNLEYSLWLSEVDGYQVVDTELNSLQLFQKS